MFWYSCHNNMEGKWMKKFLEIDYFIKLVFYLLFYISFLHFIILSYFIWFFLLVFGLIFFGMSVVWDLEDRRYLDEAKTIPEDHPWVNVYNRFEFMK